ncbi:hypothetical protein LTR62_001340 [Meristemomyces frigidus]|uniref:Eisosome protein 1 n=1 Tax=Meristemomyces frigidus TaxID=1508187 RepID=A0AAN7T947_9PEZI|nr:hypothetical protein LTR62_001340 [Meristemomyces frigidus]
MNTPTRAGEPCPDPSAHEHGHKLSNQASTAALYATKQKEDPLGSDGKLSSKSAAASLKYARAQDLPSFPSHGLQSDSDSAGKAALLAKDYKMNELWQHEASSAGSRAALLAHNKGADLNLWHPTASKDGNSAAVLAMQKKGLSPELDRGYTVDGHGRALMAATMSVKHKPVVVGPAEIKNSYPDANNASYNALNAATKSHASNRATLQDKMAPDGWNSDAMQAARVKNIGKNMDPAMFTEHPPVEIDSEEQKHQDALKASAVSMAKQMYEHQHRTALRADLTTPDSAGDPTMARQSTGGQKDIKQEAMRYIHLQDAAHKLAQERLAKIDKSSEQSRYREYYGYPDQKNSPQKSGSSTNRLSMRSRGRRRAGSDEDPDDSDDEEQARKIRNQMSQLNSGLSTVDNQKRNDDRARLMAAAEKKVHAQMHTMDEKVFADTGKVPPAMMEEWEAKARDRAQEQRKVQAQHPGKTHIGGGKFMDQSEIEAIAAARLKPTLDEIDATAAQKRARDQEIKEQNAAREFERIEEKQKQREEKDERNRLKNEEKMAKQQEKEEAKARKADDQRKSREVKRESTDMPVEGEKSEAYETSKQEKRQSTLGRFTSRLRGNKNKEPVAAAEEAKKEIDVPFDHKSPVGAQTPMGGDGVDTGIEETSRLGDEVDPVDQGVTTTEPKGKEAEVEAPTIPTIVAPVAERQGPPPAMLQHMGSYNEPLGVASGSGSNKPSLERHITNIVDSDSDDAGEDDGEEDWEKEYVRIAASTGPGTDHNELAEMGKQKIERDAAMLDAAEVGAGGSLAQEVRVPGEDELATGGPHKTLMGSLLDPNAEPKVDAVPFETVGAPTLGAVNKNAATTPDMTAPVTAAILEPTSKAVDPTVQTAPSQIKDQSIGDETGPAPNTAGPHPSDVANVVDPRVKPEPEQLKAREKQAEGKPATSTQPTQKEQTGVRGFFSKFKKDKKEPGRISSISPSKTADTETDNPTPTLDSTGSEAIRPAKPELVEAIQRDRHEDQGRSEEAAVAAGTAGPVSPISTSSFKRHDPAGPRRELDDVSSSGLEEEELTRGRGGKTTATGASTGPAAAAAAAAGTTAGGVGGEGEEEEQFEEARDHFDEGLAPPPAFAGQMKSGSPVRSTRFHEEV